MVLAKDEKEFNWLREKMKTDFAGLGWNDPVASDTEKCKKIVKLRDKATEE